MQTVIIFFTPKWNSKESWPQDILSLLARKLTEKNVSYNFGRWHDLKAKSLHTISYSTTRSLLLLAYWVIKYGDMNSIRRNLWICLFKHGIFVVRWKCVSQLLRKKKKNVIPLKNVRWIAAVCPPIDNPLLKVTMQWSAVE